MIIIHLPRRAGKTTKLFEYITESKENIIVFRSTYGLKYKCDLYSDYLTNKCKSYTWNKSTSTFKFDNKVIIFSNTIYHKDMYNVIDDLTSHSIPEWLTYKTLAVTINDDRDNVWRSKWIS